MFNTAVPSLNETTKAAVEQELKQRDYFASTFDLWSSCGWNVPIFWLHNSFYKCIMGITESLSSATVLHGVNVLQPTKILVGSNSHALATT